MLGDVYCHSVVPTSLVQQHLARFHHKRNCRSQRQESIQLSCWLVNVAGVRCHHDFTGVTLMTEICTQRPMQECWTSDPSPHQRIGMGGHPVARD